jgi:hypothetical protein
MLVPLPSHNSVRVSVKGRLSGPRAVILSRNVLARGADPAHRQTIDSTIILALRF